MKCWACITNCAIENTRKFDPDCAPRTHHSCHPEPYPHHFPRALLERHSYLSLRSQHHALKGHAFRISTSPRRHRPARDGADTLAAVSSLFPVCNLLMGGPMQRFCVMPNPTYSGRDPEIDKYSAWCRQVHPKVQVSPKGSQRRSSRSDELHRGFVGVFWLGGLGCSLAHELTVGRESTW